MIQRRQRQTPQLDADGLWGYALKSLGGRGYSTGELRSRLLRRAGRAEDVEAVLDRLKAHGYLDDRRYAETFAGARVENQGFGRARVLRDLRQRRVAPAVAREAVEAAFDGRNELELIEAFLARKYRNIPLAEHLSDPRRLASAFGRLRRAGFGASSSIRVLRRYARSADVLEEIGEAPEEPGAGV